MKRNALIGALAMLTLFTVGVYGQEKDPELSKKIAFL